MPATIAGPGRDPAATRARFADSVTASSFSDVGISLRDERPGEHRTACPHCAKRPKDDTLAVKVEPGGMATWLCPRCGWKGSLRPAWEPRKAPRPPLRLSAPPPEPEHPTAGLSYKAQRLWA